jgi:hypothetical protein
MVRPLDRSTARPLDRSTARPLDRSTARPLDRSTARPLDRSTARPLDPIGHAPGMDRYADQIGQSFCLLDRFLQLAFCWRSPPRADGLAGQGRWVHKKFFYFYPPNSPLS